MENKKHGRGGKREGAGRKPTKDANRYVFSKRVNLAERVELLKHLAEIRQTTFKDIMTKEIVIMDKEYIYSPEGKILKLSRYETIVTFGDTQILGYYDNEQEQDLLYEGEPSSVHHVMELIRKALCISLD